MLILGSSDDLTEQTLSHINDLDVLIIDDAQSYPEIELLKSLSLNPKKVLMLGDTLLPRK